MKVTQKWAEVAFEDIKVIVNVLSKYGVLPAEKSLMKLVGVDCGPTRLPVRTLTNEQFTNLYKDLEKENFFSYTSKKISVSPKLNR